MREDCDLWVERYDISASVKKPPQKPQAPLGQMPVGAQMDRLTMDSLGPLPLTLRGNQYILLALTTSLSGWKSLQYQIRQQLHVQRPY